MPSVFTSVLPRRATDTSPSHGDRFTRALVELTRAIWHPDCSLDTAVGLICESASAALQVERVNVWHYDRDAHQLRCIHAYDALAGAHASVDAMEALSLEGDDYIQGLEDVRAVDASSIESHPSTANSQSELRDYLRRHGIHALLDAPVRVEGELLGVICHESTGGVRVWLPEEITFAGSMGDYVAMAYEIVRRRRAEKQIQHLMLHDASTELPNREYMVEVVAQRLLVASASAEALAVVHVRVDASRGVALPVSAPTVDEMMVQIAKELRQHAGIDVELARVRADGFAFVLARSTSKAAAVRFAERCLATVQAMKWSQAEISPRVAVGVAFSDPEALVDARVLMRQSEAAADHARGRDKYGYEVFDIGHHDALVARLQFERALRDALEHDAFEVHYQPEYDAAQQQWLAAEALLRWRDGERLVVAGEFIEVAESCGLILPLGRWVLQRACRDAAQWPMTAAGDYPSLRVNVSARQFDDDALVEDVATALAASGLQPGRLCLEITETTLMRDIEHTVGVLKQLKATGVQVAIDDFGTGYASLSYFKRLPVDVLKIDRSFVEGIPGSAVESAIVAAVVGLAEALGIEVVAEGVERIEQQHALQALGVRRMQGWLYARAMDQASTCQLMAATCG